LSEEGIVQLLQMLQVGYFLFSLIGTGIFLAAFVTVVGWPQVRGRGLWLACLGVKALVAIGYAMLGLIHLVPLFAGRNLLPWVTSEPLQVLYLLLAVFNLTGDGLLLVALISLGGVFQAIRRSSETNAPPPVAPWQDKPV
jgi:hypothetical protein